MTHPPELYAALRAVDTPTICNAIEVVQGRRGFAGFTRRAMLASEPGARMVGHARTAAIRGAAPPQRSPEAVKAMRADYYRHMSGGPRPAVAVVADLDPEPVGAFWGEINAAAHKGLGLAGALTNGVMRDLDVLDGFPVVARSVGPSHGFVHVVAVGEPVEVSGLRVAPGDLVHADRHGAVVVPPEIAPRLPAAIVRLAQTERLVLEPARREGFDLDALLAAWAAFEKARV
jgi:regulator of RNase E activity RraA